MRTLLSLGLGLMLAAVFQYLGHVAGRYAARTHDRKYFPPAVLLRGKGRK